MSERPLVPAALARGARGAVVAPHHLATAAGLGVLRAGGSAVDAAIATNAVLGVVVPQNCGIGGDAFWLIWDASSRRQLALNGSGRSAGAMDASRLRAQGHERVPFLGPMTIKVPGAVRSWGDAHARYGRLSRDAVLAPAIELARDGFPATDDFVADVEAMAPLARGAVDGDGFDRVFRPTAAHGGPANGSGFRRSRRPSRRSPVTASMPSMTARSAPGRRPRSGRRVPHDRADLREHTSTWGEPIGIDYRGVRATTHPPNSSGVIALETLGILAQLEPPRREAFGPAGVTDPAWIHAGLEASKVALADRDRYLTDPRLVTFRSPTSSTRPASPTSPPASIRRAPPRRPWP